MSGNVNATEKKGKQKEAVEKQKDGKEGKGRRREEAVGNEREMKGEMKGYAKREEKKNEGRKVKGKKISHG